MIAASHSRTGPSGGSTRNTALTTVVRSSGASAPAAFETARLKCSGARAPAVTGATPHHSAPAPGALPPAPGLAWRRGAREFRYCETLMFSFIRRYAPQERAPQGPTLPAGRRGGVAACGSGGPGVAPTLSPRGARGAKCLISGGRRAQSDAFPPNINHLAVAHTAFRLPFGSLGVRANMRTAKRAGLQRIECYAIFASKYDSPGRTRNWTIGSSGHASSAARTCGGGPLRQAHLKAPERARLRCWRRARPVTAPRRSRPRAWAPRARPPHPLRTHRPRGSCARWQ